MKTGKSIKASLPLDLDYTIPVVDKKMKIGKAIKTVLPLGLGHATSAFDLFLFGMLTKEIAQTFFPSISNLTYMLSLILFTIPFFVRPFGGFLIGYVSHHVGPHFSLKLAAIFSVLSAVLLAITPSYAQIGVIAPLVVAICRILQGVATSAEYSNGSVIISETFSTDKTFSVTILVSFGFMGVFLAAFIIYLLEAHPFLNFRYAFSLSAIFGLVTYLLRRNSPIPHKSQEVIPAICLSRFYASYASLLIFSGIMSLCFYFCIFSFNQIYLNLVGAPSVAVNMNMLITLIWVVGIPLVGYFSRYFQMKNIIFTGQGIAFSACVLYLLLPESLETLVFLEIAIGVGGILIVAPGARLVPLFLPQHLRIRWFPFWYNFGQAAIASTAPIVTMFLLEAFSSFRACVVYLMFILWLSVLVFIRFERMNTLVHD